jgi:(1->4)-alpha-D-glucan 1-alpha-D-glucosylmutase
MLPRSTYRLQLHEGFGFRHATELVDYLDELGIDWLYTSPLLMARTGSTHGYDMVDPTRLNPELGTDREFEELCRQLRARHMGLLVDVVPNHMAAHWSNPWWLDVLESGRASRYADFFDIDWQRGSGKVLLPVLGDELSAVLERGELTIERLNDGAWLRYFDSRWPLALSSDDDVSDLPAILARQNYELRRWNGERPVNYRRFFGISDLVGLRVEDERAFRASHERLLALIGERMITGLRIDHPDGLHDPAGYLKALQRACAERLTAGAAPESRALYVVVEKILTADEVVRPDWPVHGGTGYQQMNVLNGVFVDRRGGSALRSSYERFTRTTRRFSEVVRESKRSVLDGVLEPELTHAAERLHALLSSLLIGEQLQLAAVREVLREVISCFPVYRSYVPPDAARVEGEDRRLISVALDTARALGPELPESVLLLLRSVLLLEPPLVQDAESLAACREFLLQFQQLTGPAAGKGVEDTAFYRYVPLLSLNEVGGEPDEFGLTLEDFHARSAERALHWPGALSATSTHDSKRSEDVRCRISALSEEPEAWAEAALRWQEQNAWAKRSAAGISAPEASDEYLFYQTLVGVWPFEGLGAVTAAEFLERMRTYMLKAVREAKRVTRWIDPNADYERAVAEFVTAVLDPERSADFLRDIDAFAGRIARSSIWSSLSQVALKILGPGVPDFYQGTELWDLSLVDPDNRRPVDFALRRKLLDRLRAAKRGQVPKDPSDGSLKLLVTRACLKLRKRRPALCGEGQYVPALAEGARAEQLIGFARIHQGDAVLLLAGRFFMRMPEPAGSATWRATELPLPDELPSGVYRDALSEREFTLDSRVASRLALELVFDRWPLAILEKIR